MLEQIKLCLRISHDKFDSEIQSYINACRRDLALAGIDISVFAADPLLLQAVKLYCRWQYDYENKAEQYEKAYTNLKISLALSGDYRKDGNWR